MCLTEVHIIVSFHNPVYETAKETLMYRTVLWTRLLFPIAISYLQFEIATYLKRNESTKPLYNQKQMT